MKPNSTLRAFLLVVGSSLLAISSASAQSGTWDTDADGDWTTVTNWSGDTAFATGADSTATLGNFITADRTINLDTPITIGNITASDATHNYTISGANILTLDRTDTTRPNINVTTSGRTLAIGSEIAGSDGIQKTGQGSLTLSGANSITGSTSISGGGNLVLDYTTNDNRKLPNTSTLTLGGGTIVFKGGTATENVTQLFFSVDAGTSFVREGTSTAKINLNSSLITTSASAPGSSATVAADSPPFPSPTIAWQPRIGSTPPASLALGSRWATVGRQMQRMRQMAISSDTRVPQPSLLGRQPALMLTMILQVKLL
jgi:autotransporter-associated beta strand protein